MTLPDFGVTFNNARLRWPISRALARRLPAIGCDIAATLSRCGYVFFFFHVVFHLVPVYETETEGW